MLHHTFVGIVAIKMNGRTMLHYCYVDLASKQLRTMGEEMNGLAKFVAITHGGNFQKITNNKLAIPRELFSREDLAFHEISEMEKFKLHALVEKELKSS